MISLDKAGYFSSISKYSKHTSSYVFISYQNIPTTVSIWPSIGEIPLTKIAGFSKIASPTITPLTCVCSIQSSIASKLSIPPLANTGIDNCSVILRIASQLQEPTLSLFCSRVRPCIYYIIYGRKTVQLSIELLLFQAFYIVWLYHLKKVIIEFSH